MTPSPSSVVARSLTVCAELTRAISRTENQPDVYEAALDALETGLSVRRAAILLFDPDGVMRFKAWRGLSDAYRAAVEGHTPWAVGARGVPPVIMPDVDAEPSIAALLPVVRAEGIAAMAFIPLETADGVIGKFMLYFDEPHVLSGEELQLAGLIGAQVAFAVDRTRAHEQSIRATARLAAIVESSDDAIVSKNLDGVIMSWNRGAERMFGYTADEAVGRSITIIIPADRRAEEDHVLASIRVGQPVEMETVRRHKNGSDVFISLKVSPVRDASGRIVGASKIARDMSIRKRIEAERAELHRRLMLLVEASASLLDRPQTDSVRSAVIALASSLVDADGYAIWESVPAERAWRIMKFDGLSDAFASRVVSSFQGGLPPLSTPFSKPLVVTNVDREAMVEDQRSALQHEGVRSLLACPLRLGVGGAGTLVFYYRTPHQFGEMDVQTAQTLANIAAAAMTTAGLYDEERRQRDVAHTANLVKDEFLATLSHELRTPLNAILGYSQMLDMGILDGDQRAKAVSVVTRNAESLKQIIEDVLDVSRITSGKLRLNLRTVDLEEILKNAVATVQPAADARGVTLRLDIDSDAPPVAGDADRLQQIVWNLLSNAVKFTPRGGHVDLMLEHHESLVQITVRDNGQGIEPVFLPFIFERFRQADSRFSREHGGLGLGLAIVRELAELHGGSVSADSDGAGTGATFTVSLPRLGLRTMPAPPERTLLHLVPPVHQQPPLIPLTGVRILAVDDEEDALGLLRVVLETAGADVTTAASAPRALELLRGVRYDALIADIGMPRMDGLELIRSVRQNLPPPLNEVPAAALTAYARSEDRLIALASGFQLHIAKPVNPTELVVAVAALLGRHES